MKIHNEKNLPNITSLQSIEKMFEELIKFLELKII